MAAENCSSYESQDDKANIIKDISGPKVSFSDVKKDAPDSEDEYISDVSESLDNSSELSVIDYENQNSDLYYLKS